MKRKSQLYHEIVSVENLYLASHNAAKRKRNYSEVQAWNAELESNVLKLHNDLVNKSYAVSEYTIFKIYEPKERIISKLPFRDRVVHHAILNIIEPILVNCFTVNTYSCIKGRGIYKCLMDLKRDLKQETEFALKLDIKKFYPSIDHEILKGLLRRKFKDKDLLWLLDQVIDSCEGVPLGNYTSQWFANFYLNGFDHWLKQEKKIKYYYRYCDDIVILGNDKNKLHELRKDIQDYLQTLNLELSNYQVFPVDSRGINYLGYVSYHTHIRLRKSIKLRLKRMLKRNPNEKSKASYNGWLVHADCINLKNKLYN